MDSKTNIYSLWIQYTTQNEETYFWQFISGFVDIWEKQCGVDFNNVPLWSDVQPDSVPSLSKLPDELLAAIGKFLYISTEKVEKNPDIGVRDLEEICLLFRCLFIICRNFDNIPLIASCDYVNYSEPIAACCITRLIKSSDLSDSNAEAMQSIVSSFCHFLEGMYDPYLSWRNHLLGRNADFSKLLFKPSLLHVEVIPFIYDCFQTDVILKYPNVCGELLNVLGATISGAQSMLSETNNSVNDVRFSNEPCHGNGHNALRAVCPATVALIIRIISNVSVDKDIRKLALSCFIVMVQVLHKSTPEQRQIELSLILEMYTDSIKKAISGSSDKSDISNKLDDNSGDIHSSDKDDSYIISEKLDRTDECSVDDKTSLLNDELSYMLCSALITIRKLLEDFESSRTTICQLMVDLNYINILISIPDSVAKLNLNKKSLGVESVKTLTRLLSLSRTMRKKLSIKCDYNTIITSWIDLGDLSRELLQEFIYMAMDGDRDNNSQTPLCNAEVVITLLQYIHMMQEEDQMWMSQQISWLCTKNLRSKWLACQKGTISAICEVLINHDKTLEKSMITLINLLDNLACISISSQELKKIFFILRPEKNFTHKIPLLHTLCNITRNGDSICKTYLDIQTEADGINVPNINKWNNTSYGFTFHCWLRLDKLQESHDSYNKQRQLFNLLTQSCQGLEVSVDSTGVLFINVLKKNSLQTVSVQAANLNDNKWHCVSVCVLYARRALNSDQISVFIDGTQRFTASLKFQGFSDTFVHCYIGVPIAKETKLNSKKQESEKESFHGTLVKSIFNNQFLPSIVLQAPSYLSFGSSTSKSGQTNTTGNSQETSNQAPLHGNIAHVSLFNDTLNLNAAKWLYEAGPECHRTLCSEEGADNQEMYSRLVLCYSAVSTWENTCLNLASSNVFNGITSALRVNTTGVKEVINAASNVYVLFPLLEDFGNTANSDFDLDVFFSSSSPLSEQISQQLNDWEVLPSNAFMEWKLDQNPLSMFMNLLKNIIGTNILNQEELVKYDGLAIVGLLLNECKPSLIDVNVLMAAQLFVEMIRGLHHLVLLKSIYQNIIFDFKIWSRGPFPIRIGHVQYVSNLIKHDRNYFRKNFGVQYILDVIRTYYSTNEILTDEDAKAIRLALLGIIKYLISKDFNIKELLSILGFLASVKEEFLLIETMEMLITQMESRNCKDQIFLLLHEQYTGEILYVLFLNRKFSNEFRIVLSKLILTIIQTDRVHMRNKSTMLLQEGSTSMYPGLVAFMDSSDFSSILASNLFDMMITGETKGGFTGILALINFLSFESIDVKLKLAKKLLTATFINLNAPFIIAKQIGWQDCVARLLIKRCISEASMVEEAVDLMTFDEEALKLESDTISFHSAHLPSLSEAANVIEHEIKEIAGSVSEAVADNLQYAADNLTTAVSSVYSVIKQKTVDIQESLGELGHISRSHLHSFTETDSVEYSGDTDSAIISNRSISMTSGEEDLQSGAFWEGEIVKQTPESSLPHDLNLDDKSVDKEENLSYLVAHILFTILWRGVDGSNKESWKERGQVMACINLLALNNELYCSHLQLRLRLLEMGVQAALVDLKEVGASTTNTKSNILHLMRLIYDLVVLDPNKDDTKKCSSKLLDGVLSLLDTMKVFSEDNRDPVSQELARLGLGILVTCATGNGGGGVIRVSLAAPSCALLNSLLHAGGPPFSGDADMEAAYLICAISTAMKTAVEAGNRDQYSFLIPVIKALLEKTTDSLNLSNYLPDLPSLNKGPSFFDDFETYIQGENWSSFIEYKIRPLSIAYDRETNRLVGEPLNTFWAECYEACKASAQSRIQEQAYSKELFQRHVINSFRTRQLEDAQRYAGAQGQQRARAARAAANWRARRAFLVGARGPWSQQNTVTKYWRLSAHENLSRMRLKLEAQADSQPASLAAAARLRDNLERTQQPVKPVVPPRAPRALHDILAEEELKLSLEPEIQMSDSGKEKMIVSQECELITLMTKVKGRLDVTTNYLYFHDLSPNKEDVERQDFNISLPQLREIHLRRYNLRRSALEIFLIDQTNYFLNFKSTKTRNSIFSRILSLQPPNILYGSGQSPSELLKASGLTQKWINREITNFDYLMHLNTIAGRTYNDLSQYPVYPWILADYTSEILDLENPATYRDLSRPIGVVNPKNEAEVRAKFDNFEDPTGVISKFHYGTHYSNSAGVLHYLLRVEPFTSLHIELQSGRFDVADRQFHSITQTWKMLMNNPNDVKELTPEFFYFPEFLQNINNLDLGVLQGTNIKIGDVALPPWAEGSAENFIYLHRKALESDYVSENLHHWIDLIFGYKQKGPRAIEALNVFYYCSYEGAVDLDAIADPSERAAVEGMIANFGQVPAQLIRSSPHPVRLTAGRAANRALRGEIKSLHCLHLLSHLTTTPIQISRPDDPIIWLGGPCRGRGFLQSGGRWLTSITRNGVIHTPSWQPHSPTAHALEPESSSSTLKTRRQISIIRENNYAINSKLIAMSSDGKLLYVGGHWDCSIKIYSVSSKVKSIGSVTKHFKPVTCLALDSCSEQWLVSGSSDTTLAVWEVGSSPGTLHLKNFLCGHDAPITCTAIMAELDIVVSGSKDGTVNVYTLKKGEYVITLYPKGCQGVDIDVRFIVLSHQGHIGFVVNDQIYHSVHVYNINGNWRVSKNVCGRVTALCTVGDCLLIADDAGDITISTAHSLKPVYDVPLHVPIEHVLITPHNTHILVAMRDGKVSIIGLPSANKNTPLIDTI